MLLEEDYMVDIEGLETVLKTIATLPEKDYDPSSFKEFEDKQY